MTSLDHAISLAGVLLAVWLGSRAGRPAGGQVDRSPVVPWWRRLRGKPVDPRRPLTDEELAAREAGPDEEPPAPGVDSRPY